MQSLYSSYNIKIEFIQVQVTRTQHFLAKIEGVLIIVFADKLHRQNDSTTNGHTA